MSVWSQAATRATVSLILTKLGAHHLCANMQKNLELIFVILIFEFLRNFLNFKIGLGFWNSSSRALR